MTTTEERLTALEDSMSTGATEPQLARISQLEDLLAKNSVDLSLLEREVQQSQKIIAAAVLETVREDSLIKLIIQRTTEAVEVEWTTKFLPELRRTIRTDLAEASRIGSDPS